MKIIGNSQEIQQIHSLIRQFAVTKSNILILGESGTGKELVAQHIHANSLHKSGPFIAINCGAIPAELLESELFGHEKGAFTGAFATRKGKFELANGGTIFLDEIGDMPLSMQVKLLRVLQEKVIERVGGAHSIPTNVRLVAATNTNLTTLIKEGKFRQDLFFRLNVLPITLPSLKERKGDIRLLIEHFLNGLKDNITVCSFNERALEYMQSYPWPGNIRELANIVERLAVLYPNQEIDISHLHINLPVISNQDAHSLSKDKVSALEACDLRKLSQTLLTDNKGLQNFALKDYLFDLEKEFIQCAMENSNGIVAQAAKKLGMQRTTLVEKIKKFQCRSSEILHN